ncbi:MAG: FecR domain-containing protein [Myxococcota bacterium]|nr:FecR domain-containing protein [Myxococcota bacterium]
MSDDIRDPSERSRDLESFDASRELSDADARALDRLARLAREAEPPKLSAGETDALVLAVLARRKEPVRLDSMPPSLCEEPLTPEERELARPDPLEVSSEAAGAREPRDARARDERVDAAPGARARDERARDGRARVRDERADAAPDERVDERVDELAARRAERGAREAGRRRWAWAAAAALALGAIGGSLGGFAIGRGELARGEDDAPSRVTLPTGDAIVATPGAELAFVESSDAARRVEVRSGTVLFDVAPLAPGERFVVNARGVRAEVRGTVFSVGADARVRVYEGAVAVEQGSASALVTAGRMWADGAVRARDEGPLEAQGLEAAARRTTLASREVGARGDTDDALVASADLDGTVESAGSAADGTVESAGSAADGTVESATDGTSVANGDVALGDGASDASDANDANDARDTNGANDANGDVRPIGASGAGDDGLGASAVGRSAAATVRLTPDGSTAARATATSARGTNDDARITPERLAQWIAGGEAERALVEARRRGWRLSEADALRALRRGEEALTIYERLASRDGYAAFTGARVAQELGDRRRALTLLERAPTSAFDERALGLRVRLLVEGGRRAEALPLAASYVERFPNGSLAEWMRALPDAE